MNPESNAANMIITWESIDHSLVEVVGVPVRTPFKVFLFFKRSFIYEDAFVLQVIRSLVIRMTSLKYPDQFRS